ncbi:MAG: hemerythrin domain-containing protein, partial [Pseudomonadota bacterium]|nr:hemerythrin domain-containing protein [Pseudomonadota bacterium]
HVSEMQLCDSLEQMADSLPDSPNRQTGEIVARHLRDCLIRHRLLEEDFLLPLLISRAREADNAKALQEQIAREHISDESMAHDLADQLEAASATGRIANPEMLGYMLHGFFECRRRHIAWETAVVLPLAVKRLRVSDWRAFSASEFEALVVRKRY